MKAWPDGGYRDGGADRLVAVGDGLGDRGRVGVGEDGAGVGDVAGADGWRETEGDRLPCCDGGG